MTPPPLEIFRKFIRFRRDSWELCSFGECISHQDLRVDQDPLQFFPPLIAPRFLSLRPIPFPSGRMQIEGIDLSLALPLQQCRAAAGGRFHAFCTRLQHIDAVCFVSPPTSRCIELSQDCSNQDMGQQSRLILDSTAISLFTKKYQTARSKNYSDAKTRGLAQANPSLLWMVWRRQLLICQFIPQIGLISRVVESKHCRLAGVIWWGLINTKPKSCAKDLEKLVWKCLD